MDATSKQTLIHLILTQRTAALGTLRDGWPSVSLVLFAPADDFTAFYIHVSRLAHHTQDLLQDRRAGLMLSQTDDGVGNPQTFARLSILGEAFELSTRDSDFPRRPYNLPGEISRSTPHLLNARFQLIPHNRPSSALCGWLWENLQPGARGFSIASYKKKVIFISSG